MEDDPVLGETLEDLLQDEGYEVDLAIDGEAAAECSFSSTYDLYIFDINVPHINGFELLEQLRNADDRTPTIFISALVDLDNILKGFELGADDYLKKPFFPEELLVRIQAKFASLQQEISVGKIRYDPVTQALYLNEDFLHLSEIQKALFKLFIHNLGQTIDKALLLECLDHPSDSALRVHINKLKHLTSLPIQNVRGVGYRLQR